MEHEIFASELKFAIQWHKLPYDVFNNHFSQYSKLY